MKNLGLSVTYALALVTGALAAPSQQLDARQQPFKSTAITDHAEPWAIAFLPDNRVLVTERRGNLRIVDPATKSKGTIQLVSGAVSGGAQLVVKPDITSVEGLKGKTIATPQLANTQDVALKKFLAGKQLTDQVKITNLDNSKTLDAFKKGEVDGGWLPEPWSSRLVLDAGAKVLVDEKTLWPDGRFPTTVVIVRSEFLQQHPDTVKAVLKGQLAAIDWAKANPADAKTVVNGALKELAGSSLSQAVIDRAFSNIELTTDPIPAEFPQLAQDSVTAGVVKSAVALKGFADFGPLNEVLKEKNQPAVNAPELAK